MKRFFHVERRKRMEPQVVDDKRIQTVDQYKPKKISFDCIYRPFEGMRLIDDCNIEFQAAKSR